MEELEKSTLEKFSQKIFSHTKAIAIILVGLCIIVVALVCFKLIEVNINKKANEVGEKLEDSYISYLQAKGNKEQKPNAFTNRTNELQALLKEYENVSLKRYSGYRLTMIKAQLAKEEEKYLDAATYLFNCAKINTHPLASLMLLEAATLYEDNGDSDKAFESVNLAVKKAKKDSPFYTQAVFALGRLQEEKGMINEAIKMYKKIADLKSDDSDDYSNLAASRIIVLENGGAKLNGVEE